EALTLFFKDGLDTSLRQAVFDLRPMPRTLQEWKDGAREIDLQQQERDAEEAARRFSAKPSCFFFQTPAAPPRSTTTTSQSHQTNTTCPLPFPTSTTPAPCKDATGLVFGGQGQPMDIDVARRRGLCFKCHKPGHLGRNCP
ncbi:hypothetical protein BC835DRAFT_1216317, partial [Cytidiella melzeri]